jgi:hypothetical protein
MLDLLHRTRKTACASLLACGVLLAVGASASGAEPLPTVVTPRDQASAVGHGKTVIVTGEGLAELSVTGLPTGVPPPTKVSPTEWKIEGAGTTAEVTTVILEPKNGEGTPGPTVSFKWTVNAVPEAAPTIAGPVDQESTTHTTIAPVIVKGANLANVTAKELPVGLTLKAVGGTSETEWEIAGEPSTAKPAVEVTLEAENKEEAPAAKAVTFKWTVYGPATIEQAPANQTSVRGKPITPVIFKGADLANVASKELPQGLALKRVGGSSETEWEITGEPLAAKTSTEVTLEPENKAHTHGTSVTFKWTVNEPEASSPPKIETPSKPPETPSKPPETPKAVSAGRLGTMPTQKKGRELWASFLCEVASCKVQVMATITAGKTKFKLHSVRTPIAQGKKMRIALKLTKKQQALIVAALNKRKKVTAALSASIDSSVGRQVTKALVVTVKR